MCGVEQAIHEDDADDENNAFVYARQDVFIENNSEKEREQEKKQHDMVEQDIGVFPFCGNEGDGCRDDYTGARPEITIEERFTGHEKALDEYSGSEHRNREVLYIHRSSVADESALSMGLSRFVERTYERR